MGWGVDSRLSYPARLAQALAPELGVLNLGVDGFGAIGATAKSRALADRYPPAAAVYLFCPNDLDDDVQAAALARRGSGGARRVRRVDALPPDELPAGRAVRAALPAAVPGRAGRAGRDERGEDGRRSRRKRTRSTALDPTKLLLPEPASPPAPRPTSPTFAALREYRDFLAARGARLVVLALSNQPESLMAYRFCKEQGIEAHLFDVPPEMRIPDEGHFNALGNAAVAALVDGAAAARPRTGPGARMTRTSAERDMSDWTTGDGRVDVAAVMNRIREKIRGRRDLGLYTDEEVEELTALKLQAFADDAGIDPELLARLMADNHNWNISTDYRIETAPRRASARARS